MTRFWLILSLTLLSAAHAVSPAHCPRTLEFQGAITRLHNLGNSTLPATMRQEHLPLMEEMQNELSWEPTMDMNFNISFAASGACYYEGRDFTGLGYQAKIESTSEGISLLIFNDNRAMKIPLAKVSPAGVTAKEDKLEFHYRVKICSTSRCRSKNYPIASGDIDGLN